jgi:2-polyprenyl-3-methyl-5-hydroxy-6-metoxy-1,4-benzoquinol methylase
MKDATPITTCLLCGSSIELVLELTQTPPANELVESPDIAQDVFSLNLVQCKTCNHLQLDTEVSKERLFRHYHYVSNTSESNRKYFQSYANDMMERFRELPNQFIVDIASNDGLFLSFFQVAELEVLGVDPAQNIAMQANKNGIPTLCEFFNEATATKIVNNYGKASLITCNNAFAHNADLSPIVKGVKKLLTNEGAFVFEVSYAIRLLQNNLFDLIYHEHVHHHHLTPLIEYLNKFDLFIYDVQEISTHGGSIRVFVQHKKASNTQSANLVNLLNMEAEFFDMLIEKFQKNVKQVKAQVINKLDELKAQHKTIGVLGWPAKATTLSYYFDLNKDIISWVFDDNELKIGKFSPGQHFPILATSDIYKVKPDALLVLSWNYADALLARFGDCGAEFIVPLPKFQVTKRTI